MCVAEDEAAMCYQCLTLNSCMTSHLSVLGLSRSVLLIQMQGMVH